MVQNKLFSSFVVKKVAQRGFPQLSETHLSETYLSETHLSEAHFSQLFYGLIN